MCSIVEINPFLKHLIKTINNFHRQRQCLESGLQAMQAQLQESKHQLTNKTAELTGKVNKISTELKNERNAGKLSEKRILELSDQLKDSSKTLTSTIVILS